MEGTSVQRLLALIFLLCCSTNQEISSPTAPPTFGPQSSTEALLTSPDSPAVQIRMWKVEDGNQPTGHMTLQSGSRSDEGLNRFNIGGHGASTPSWSSVTGKPTAPPTSSASLLIRLLLHLLVLCPYFISTLIMVSLYRCRTTGSDPSVSMEMTPSTHPEEGLDDDYEDVTTDYHF